ncbi:hypothetical protein A2415_04330 [candidate division WWE3 bacterium RIFOXYC1_FULL_39_7]|uniref:Uncharacterized protein n=1 Tax=candidate division WWE3 bacterium RIFOXYC1_FULL_39_7 TaxID=1802643 RepID=A0A1F4WLN9_UNCKA|nr:MAG: hypothetical protein A2415_04330 [candidate division WWE3 bacterium RIFOXYC1_FULL_39_7]
MAWEQGITGGHDFFALCASLGGFGPIQFMSHARVFEVRIKSLTQQEGELEGTSFNITGTAKDLTSGRLYNLDPRSWYNTETQMGHFIMTPVFEPTS